MNDPVLLTKKTMCDSASTESFWGANVLFKCQSNR